MTKILVDMTTYAALSQAIERTGRTINDGKPLTIEKGEAIMPPVDFKSAGIRQNCLIACATAWPKDQQINNIDFINFCEASFNWVLKGEIPKPTGWTIAPTAPQSKG